MAYDPRLTSYQIPYQPLFDSTRQQIERSLFSLQEKLRRRRQIDLEMSPARAIDPIISVIPPPLRYPDPLVDIERERAHRIAIQEEMYLKKTAEENQYLARMEQLKFERDQLARQAILSGPRPFISTNTFQNPSDEELIRKYQDGSKAKQYYKDLEKQLDKQQEQEIRRVRAQFEKQQQLKDRLNAQIDRQKQQHHKQYTTDRSGDKYKDIGKIVNKQIEATPYDHVRQPKSNYKNSTDQKNNDRKHLVKELKKEFDQLPVKQFQKSNKKHSQSVLKFPSTFHETNRTASPVKFLNDTTPKQSHLSPYKQRLNKYNSLGKMSCNRSRSNLSPNRTIHENSYLQAKTPKGQSKPSMHEIESNAIKKIQNRLKVSKVIYQDSTFRNIKYELNHLFNTYDVELKCRRQIRDKINGHPLVLRKHSMVVQ